MPRSVVVAVQLRDSIPRFAPFVLSFCGQKRRGPPLVAVGRRHTHSHGRDPPAGGVPRPQPPSKAVGPSATHFLSRERKWAKRTLRGSRRMDLAQRSRPSIGCLPPKNPPGTKGPPLPKRRRPSGAQCFRTQIPLFPLPLHPRAVKESAVHLPAPGAMFHGGDGRRTALFRSSSEAGRRRPEYESPYVCLCLLSAQAESRAPQGAALPVPRGVGPPKAG